MNTNSTSTYASSSNFTSSSNFKRFITRRLAGTGVGQLVEQAMDTMEVLRSKLPTPETRKRLTNQKLGEGLAKIGLATRAETEELRAKIASLEAQIASSGKKNSSDNQNASSGKHVDGAKKKSAKPVNKKSSKVLKTSAKSKSSTSSARA